jgi:hypothetical protein
MSDRFFWGTPHTSTEVDQYKKAVDDLHLKDPARYPSAVQRVTLALERITAKSSALLGINSILAAVTLLLAFGRAAELPRIIVNLQGSAFIFVLLSCLVLLPNLAVIWSRHPARDYGTVDGEFDFTMKLCKVRAARFTIALGFTILAVAAVLFSLLWLTKKVSP